MGATSFESNVTTDAPLTWTVVGNSDRFTTEQAPRGAKRIMKNFYLGTPSSLRVQDGNFHGCSLLFFNITSALQTVPGFSDFPNFSCDTVLGNQCVTDLLSQARSQLDDRLASASPTEPADCRQIGKTLSDSLPDSCRLPFGRTSWGPINVIGKHFFQRHYSHTDGIIAGFAGTDNVSYISNPENGCDITSQGSSYNTVLTNTVFQELDPSSEDAALWRNGTTPLITMLYRRAGDATDALLEPEVHLSCLRTVPSREASSSNARARLAGFSWLAFFAASVVILSS